MNTAIDQARAWRRGKGQINPSSLHALAKDDAQRILDSLRDGAEVIDNETLVLLHSHLTVTELTATIYRHAMVESGAIEDAAARLPYNPCPICGHAFS